MFVACSAGEYSTQVEIFNLTERAQKFWRSDYVSESKLDGVRGKKQVWRPHVRTCGLSGANVLY